MRLDSAAGEDCKIEASTFMIEKTVTLPLQK